MQWSIAPQTKCEICWNELTRVRSGHMDDVAVSMCKPKNKIWTKYFNFGSDHLPDLERIRVARPSSAPSPMGDRLSLVG